MQSLGERGFELARVADDQERYGLSESRAPFVLYDESKGFRSAVPHVRGDERDEVEGERFREGEV